MITRASIDIGSNSILLLVANLECSGVVAVENEANVTGLGRDLDQNGVFLDIAMDESFCILREYKNLCSKHGIEAKDIIATATEASRVATNAIYFYKKIKKELGINVQIISGEAEAYYSAMGILFDEGISDKEITIMDIGGASTELINVDTVKKQIITSFSMPMGAVRFNNWREDNTFDVKVADIFSKFSKNLSTISTNKLYCVAGTMTSVGNIYLREKKFVESQVNGLEFKYEEIPNMIERYKEFEPKDYLNEFPFLGKRSGTIQSGLLLADIIMKKLSIEIIYISTYGLRYGTLLEGNVKDEYVIC
jgi:exopolyphosphatase/guanosine-5'-triphosphate,3'-diphosphate pyrophosphatase